MLKRAKSVAVALVGVFGFGAVQPVQAGELQCRVEALSARPEAQAFLDSYEAQACSQNIGGDLNKPSTMFKLAQWGNWGNWGNWNNWNNWGNFARLPQWANGWNDFIN